MQFAEASIFTIGELHELIMDSLLHQGAFVRHKNLIRDQIWKNHPRIGMGKGMASPSKTIPARPN